MKREISPVVAVIVILLVVGGVAVVLWKGTQKEYGLSGKPPSGPIILPPSQQGRIMPGGRPSGPMVPPTAK